MSETLGMMGTEMKQKGDEENEEDEEDEAAGPPGQQQCFAEEHRIATKSERSESNIEGSGGPCRRVRR